MTPDSVSGGDQEMGGDQDSEGTSSSVSPPALSGSAERGMWIEGVETQASTESSPNAPLQILNPATGQVLAHVLEGGAEGVDAAVTSASRAFADRRWSGLTPAERERILHRLADKVEAHQDELANLLILENGKLRGDAEREVGGSARFIRFSAGWATRISGETLNPSMADAQRDFMAYTRREPVGVVAGVIPWNFPLAMAVWKSAPALACGCTVVLKPSELTPLSALRYAELAVDAGVPPGVLNVVTGAGATGAALVADARVAKVAFTGSTAVGRRIGQAATGRLARISLELGGKSPVLVFADADLDRAASLVAKGIFYNQGQVCAAGSRLYVEHSIYGDFVGAVAEQAKSMRLGPGWDPASQLGPLISSDQRQRVAGYVDQAVEQGAEALCGGQSQGGEGFFYEPTVLSGTPQNSPAVQEEIFGPVLTAIPFRGVEEAVRLANDSSYGLSASIYSEDLSRVHSLIPQIQAGSVFVNMPSKTDPALPMGGVKQSGIGREHGSAMVDLYTELKTVVISYKRS